MYRLLDVLNYSSHAFYSVLKPPVLIFLGKKSRVNKMVKRASPLTLEKNKRKLIKKKILMINYFCKRKLKANIVEMFCM